MKLSARHAYRRWYEYTNDYAPKDYLRHPVSIDLKWCGIIAAGIILWWVL